MKAPTSVVADVHAGLALAVGLDDRAIHVEVGTVEELRGLLSPCQSANLVECGHQRPRFDVLRFEAPAEVACGGRVGQCLGADGVELASSHRRSSKSSIRVPLYGTWNASASTWSDWWYGRWAFMT